MKKVFFFFFFFFDTAQRSSLFYILTIHSKGKSVFFSDLFGIKNIHFSVPSPFCFHHADIKQLELVISNKKKKPKKSQMNLLMHGVVVSRRIIIIRQLD
jgi:hypothetical protein